MHKENDARLYLPYLRQWRQYRGMSLKMLGEESGVSYVTISLLENGKQRANFLTIERLSRGLGITKEQLLHTEPASSYPAERAGQNAAS